MIQIIDKTHAKLIVSIGSGDHRRRKTKTVTYKNKKELQKMYDRFEDEVRHNPLIDTTVEELVEAYIKNRKVVGIKPTTEVGYKVAKERIITAFQGVLAKDLTTYQIDDFIADMVEKGGRNGKGYSAKTIRNTIGLLNAAYERAVKTDQLLKNPCANASLPKKNKPDIRTFSEEEVVQFLKALENERRDYQVAYELCLLCGMRRSEVLGLREEDINLPFRTISISKTRHYVDGRQIIQDTKTEMSRRTLSMPDIVARHIALLIEEHHAIRYDHTDWLVQDGFGQPMNPNVMTDHINLIERDSGLSRVSVHGLRHTFATMLNSEGIDIARISAELGHGNITTTLNIYTHVFGGASASSRGIADTLDKKFRQPATFLPLSENEKTAEA